VQLDRYKLACAIAGNASHGAIPKAIAVMHLEMKTGQFLRRDNVFDRNYAHD
jgi:hypothetical protein